MSITKHWIAGLALAAMSMSAFAQKPPPFAETLLKAERGDLKAQFNVGLLYENGHGVKKDMAKAFEWYERAAERHLGPAQSNLGLLYMTGQGTAKDIRSACVWFTLAVEKNVPDDDGNKAKTCNSLSASDKEWVSYQVRARRGTMI
jgi:TPR repeat protein